MEMNQNKIANQQCGNGSKQNCKSTKTPNDST